MRCYKLFGVMRYAFNCAFFLSLFFSLAFSRGVFLGSMSTLMAVFQIVWLFFVR